MSISGPSSAYDSETFGQDASFHLEQPIGAMTISPSGRDVALASKDGLHIIDLDSPYSPPRHLPHRTPWEVADVQWSPFASRDYWVVSTSNQKALVWNLDAKSWQDNIQHVLHGHRRAITDINFSAHNPDVLATCAVDAFVHCWDLRSPSRPAVSFSDWFAAATSVKWSRQDENVLASSHDKFLHIWDTRKGAIPVRTIEAHNTRIYGVDWNRFQQNKIVTCSLDRTIKFWDIHNQEDEPERVIETPFPVWRARHTPFGWGMIAMPQRGSGDLYLYDRRPIDGHLESGHVRPVAKFSGHHGQVKEFLWRARGGFQDGVDQREFQLISWGTDRELRLHRLDPDALISVGYEKGVSRSQNLNFTRRGARYVTFRDIPEDVPSPAETPSRGDSLPSQHQLLAFRKRNSTTVGMSKVPVSQIKGWVSSQRRSSRIAMHGKTSTTADINPIAWLKNVKIASWDPDALAEEIRHVGEKFKRVEFETVDIKHRKVVMSLQAPWSEHQNAVYLRVDIRFPQSYPRGANAIIAVQNTSALPDELHDILSGELQTIAEVFASQQRGCLEAILRYLLREQSLEQIVAYVRGDSLTESKILGPEAATAEDSSDSDDDQIVGQNDILAASANIRVPLAKGCGAVWSETGQLVCFFPPKPKEPASVLTGLSAHTLDRSDTGRLFEGFGRLHADSPGRKTNNKARMMDDDDDSGSDTSDSLLSSSSSSSSSSEPVPDLQGAFGPYRKGMLAFPPRTKSIDMSNRSTTLAGAKAAAAEAQRQTIVSIKTFDDLIPSKKELAERYRIFYAGTEVCTHNANAANDLGRQDLASVWMLASMILSRSVPLRKVDMAEGDFLVIARKAISQTHGKAGAPSLQEVDDIRGQVRWGSSPLASQYLIPAMFDYFERSGDIQMLAMLSCIFTESGHEGNGRFGPSERSGPDYFPSTEVAKSLLHPPPATFDYSLVATGTRPQMSRLLSSLDEETLVRSRRGTAMSLDPSSASYRLESDGRLWSRAPSTADDFERRSATVSLSTSPEGGRAIHRVTTNSAAQASLSALTQSYSHSPPGHPSSSNVATSLKKYSPSGSLTPGWGLWSGHGTRATRASIHHSESLAQEKEVSLRSSASLANIRSLRRSGQTTPEITRRSLRSFAPSEASDTTRTNVKGRKKTIRSTLRNQSKFDLDSYVSLPLLDPDLEWKYQGYRLSYATLLEAWGLHLQRAEILKVDGIPRRTGPSASSSPGKQGRRKTLQADDLHQQEAVQIRRCCNRCGNVLAPIEKNGVAVGWHCTNMRCTHDIRKASKRSFCSICMKAVTGVAVPCLECNHLSCTLCARAWFGAPHTAQRPHNLSISMSTTDVGSAVDFGQQAAIVLSTQSTRGCPTGCGCPCASLKPSSVRVPDPADSIVASSPTDTILGGLRAPPSMARTGSQISTISEASQATTSAGSDSTLNAFFNLTGVRSRAGSKAERGRGGSVSAKGKGRTSGSAATPGSDVGVANGAVLTRTQTDTEAEQALNPWANSKFASLGRNVGGGLSRGLSSKGSDSTIRQGK